MEKKGSQKTSKLRKDTPIALFLKLRKTNPFVLTIIVAVLYLFISVVWYLFSKPLFGLLFGDTEGDQMLIRYGVFFYVLLAIAIYLYLWRSRMSKDAKEAFSLIKELKDSSTRYDELEQLNLKYDLVIQGSNDGIWEWDIPNDIFTFSDQWMSKFGFTSQTVPKHSKEVVQMILPADRLRVLRSMREYRQRQSGKYECTFRFAVPSGEIRTVLSKGQAVWVNGEATQMAGSHTDVTETIRLRDQLFTKAYFEELTGLPSKLSLEEYVTDLLKNDANHPISLIYLDIDDFKHINQVLGHHGGDILLVELAKLLKNSISESDFLAHIGGDEFVIVVPNDSEKWSDFQHIDNILSHIEKVFTIESLKYYVAFSAGISRYPIHGNSFSELFQNADTALHEAKARGKDQIVVYEETLSEVVKQITELSSNIRLAIDGNQLTLHYQPIIDLKTRSVHGFEALLRWIHPTQGTIMPGQFIPLASKSPLIVLIDEYVLEKAFQQKMKWENDELVGVTLSINLSRQSLFLPSLISDIQDLLKKYPIKTRDIIFEITEYTAFSSHVETVIQALTQLRKLGFQIAMDDFGSGYSSLTNLERLPLDIVKIDRGFIAKTLSSKNQRIVKTMIDLIHGLGMNVTCEGVEHLDQLQSVTEFQSDFVQGFYFSAAVAEENLVELIRKKY